MFTMKMRPLMAMLIFAVAIISAPAFSIAQSSMMEPAKVILLMIPGVTLDDLISMDRSSNIGRIMSQGGAGLLNTRTGGRISEPGNASAFDSKYAPEASYLTIGSGSRAQAGPEAGYAFDVDEPLEGTSAGNVYYRRTLIDYGSSGIVHTEIAAILRNNSTSNYTVNIGGLGSILREAGVRTSAFGNSDDTDPHREIVTIAMDEKGLVESGSVSKSNLRSMLLGIRDQIESPAPAFIAIEFGELGRLERNSRYMMDSAYANWKQISLANVDDFIGKLMDMLGKEGVLIVLSPYPAMNFLQATNNNLCPILMTGKGIDHGLLQSGSTRRPGLITNLDVAPTILSLFGISTPVGMVGRQATTVPSSDIKGTLANISENATVQSINMPVLYQAIGIMIAIGAIVLIILLINPAKTGRGIKAIEFLALIPPSMISALFLTGFFRIGNVALTSIFVIAVTTAIYIVVTIISRNKLQAFMYTCLIFVLCVLIDIASGGYLCGQSVIGYSVVGGSRFYGIGNEVMGALIGALVSTIGIYGAIRKWRESLLQLWLAIGLIVGAVFIGLTVFGSNTGGLISVVTAFGIALVLTFPKKRLLRGMLMLAVSVVIILAVFVGIDMMRGGSGESHLGRAFGSLSSGGFEQLIILIKRKLLMNAMLVRTSLWSRLVVIFGFGIILPFVYRKPNYTLGNWPMSLRVGFIGAIAGACAAFIFNDSGIVAAGTCIIYAWSLALLIFTSYEQYSSKAT